MQRIKFQSTKGKQPNTTKDIAYTIHNPPITLNTSRNQRAKGDSPKTAVTDTIKSHTHFNR